MEAIHWLVKRVRQALFDRPYHKKETIAGRYNIEKVIGNGSYGIIYLCWDLNSKQRCIVKQMRKSKQKENKQNYIRETAILRMFDHPSIPTILETFSFDNKDFFAMDYIEGDNLEDVLFSWKQQYNEYECLVLFKELVSIIHYIHEKGIVHGDLRIPNVIINDKGLYLIDFGLALHLDTNPIASKNNKMFTQDDFYDLGDCLLFILYSSYDAPSKKGRPWTEELDLHPKTSAILRKLLQIDEAYDDSKEILHDVNQAIRCL